MSCSISKGRKEPCKDKVGGLYKLYLANYGTLTGLTYSGTDGSVSGTTETSLYEYELKGTNSFVQSMVSSRDNGTTNVTQTLTISLKGLDAATSNEIKLIAYGRPHAIITDNNGNSWLAGKDFGLELTTGDANTGTAMGDAYSYTLTLVGTEKEYANYVTGSSLSDPLGGITATVVAGS